MEDREAILYGLVAIFLALYYESGHVMFGHTYNGWLILLRW